MLGHLFTPPPRQRVRPALSLPVAGGVGQFVFGEAFHASAADSPGQFVGVALDRVVPCLQPEPRHQAAPGSGDHREVAWQAIDAGGVEAHADPLHAVVGRDEDPGEAAAAGNARHAHPLRAEGLLHRSQRRLGVAADNPSSAERPLELGDSLGCRIDRAGHARGPRSLDRPQGHDKIFELQQRPAAVGSHDTAGRPDDRSLGRTYEHDVGMLRIDQHQLHPRQSSEHEHLNRQRFTTLGRLGHAAGQPGQRDLAAAVGGGINPGQGLLPLPGDLRGRLRIEIVDKPRGIDRDAAHGLVAKTASAETLAGGRAGGEHRGDHGEHGDHGDHDDCRAGRRLGRRRGRGVERSGQSGQSAHGRASCGSGGRPALPAGDSSHPVVC